MTSIFDLPISSHRRTNKSAIKSSSESKKSYHRSTVTKMPQPQTLTTLHVQLDKVHVAFQHMIALSGYSIPLLREEIDDTFKQLHNVISSVGRYEQENAALKTRVAELEQELRDTLRINSEGLAEDQDKIENQESGAVYGRIDYGVIGDGRKRE